MVFRTKEKKKTQRNLFYEPWRIKTPGKKSSKSHVSWQRQSGTIIFDVGPELQRQMWDNKKKAQTELEGKYGNLKESLIETTQCTGLSLESQKLKPVNASLALNPNTEDS